MRADWLHVTETTLRASNRDVMLGKPSSKDLLVTVDYVHRPPALGPDEIPNAVSYSYPTGLAALHPGPRLPGRGVPASPETDRRVLAMNGSDGIPGEGSDGRISQLAP